MQSSAADRAPAPGLWDSFKTTATAAYKEADKHLNPISKKIEVATGHKFNLSKIVPITIALLLTPMPIVLGAFAIGAVVLIVHPSTIMKHPELATSIAHGIGIHAAIYAIGYAVLMANPAMMALHLTICAAAFLFAKKMQDDSFREKLAKDDMPGLGSGAPAPAPERDDGIPLEERNTGAASGLPIAKPVASASTSSHSSSSSEAL